MICILIYACYACLSSYFMEQSISLSWKMRKKTHIFTKLQKERCVRCTFPVTASHTVHLSYSWKDNVVLCNACIQIVVYCMIIPFFTLYIGRDKKMAKLYHQGHCSSLSLTVGIRNGSGLTPCDRNIKKLVDSLHYSNIPFCNVIFVIL